MCTRSRPTVSVSTCGAVAVVMAVICAKTSRSGIAIDPVWHGAPATILSPTARRRTGQHLELTPCRAARVTCIAKQPQKHFRGCDRVATGTMAILDLDVVVPRDPVERAPVQ